MPLTTPHPPDLEPRRRRRAALVLGGVALLLVIALIVLVAFLLGRGLGPQGGPALPGTPAGPGVQVAPGPDAGGWDVAAETALATRPMLALPESAALPHALTTATAGPQLRLPDPTQTAGRWIPGGFPDTPEGAVAQLAALTTAGFVGGDPQVYQQAYQSIAQPGAPAPERARLTTDLQRFRARAGLPATGPVNGLDVTWRLTDALVKGTTDGGRYAVVCVLGELTVAGNGQSISGGGGDCQALRYVEGNWQISPGAAAAPAALAWPGSAESVAAGYRQVS